MKRKMPLLKHVMTPFPYSIELDAPIAEARALMEEHSVRHLPVLENHELVGIISERDIAVLSSLGEQFMDLSSCRVSAICARNPYTVDSHTDVATVALHMAEHHLSSVVITHNNKMAGIFTTNDVCRFLGEHLQDLYGGADGEPDAA